MKKHTCAILSILLVFCISLSLSVTVMATNENTTVYITQSGTKYHCAGCSYLKNSNSPISLKSAVDQGCTPCSKCNPPTLSSATAATKPTTPTPTPSVTPATPGLANFNKANTYTPGQFKDVSTNAWYAGNVKTAYELNLVKGVSTTSFNPNGNVTISETVALASRIHSIYNTGSAEFKQGNPWYQVYVDYAVKNGIITSGQFTNYNQKSTRAQFASILSKALPDSALSAINNVSNIPDVPTTATYAASVYKLYNAGVLTGNDKYGTFAPESNIQRSAVAAIVTRMADKTLRQKVVLADLPKSTIDLTGEWKQSNSGSTDSWQAATIDESTITVYWVSDNGATKSLYWAGTFTAPATDAQPYSWNSKNDFSQTDSALLASPDDTKTFTYQNGIISYSASALGTTRTIQLKQVKN